MEHILHSYANNTNENAIMLIITIQSNKVRGA